MRRAVALLVALSLVVASPPPPATAAGRLQWGLHTLTSRGTPKGACLTFVKTWGQELGLSGVTRLRARFERRSPYDPGYLPSYGKSPWSYSAPFPNDALSYSDWFWSSLVYPAGGRYQLRYVLIGERPGLWLRDLKTNVRLTPEIGCEISVDFSG